MNRFVLSFIVFVFGFSFAVEKYIKTKGDTPIFIKNEAREKLVEAYEGRKKEKPFCLLGSGDKVNRLIEPEVISNTDTTTSWKTGNCENKKDFLGYVHNHEVAPIPSKKDEFRFALNDDSKVELIAYQSSSEVNFYAYFFDED